MRARVKAKARVHARGLFDGIREHWTPISLQLPAATGSSHIFDVLLWGSNKCSAAGACHESLAFELLHEPRRRCLCDGIRNLHAFRISNSSIKRCTKIESGF